MNLNLLTNRRKKTRGASVYVGGIQAASLRNTDVRTNAIASSQLSRRNQRQEPIGRASIASNSRLHEEPVLQNTPAPTRTRTFEFNLPPNAEIPQSRKSAIGDTARPHDQSLHPTKPEVKGDDGLGDNVKVQGNALEAIQARFTAAKSSRVWDTYVRKAEEEDKDLVEDWDRIIDVTLVFAALFSAISTGFVLESSKNLQPDQAKATVLAIQSLAAAIQAGTNGSAVQTTTSDEDSFRPTVLTIWVNCLWFLSLGLSISVSLFAMLAKRWCYVFRSKRTGTSHERAMKRQKSWDAIEKWKIELLIEQLPTLMHIALMLFFFGLVVYLAEIHQTTMAVTAGLVGLTVALYAILTVLPLWYQTCPMVTPFTRIMQAMHWYLLQCFRFIATQTRLCLGRNLVLTIAPYLFRQLLVSNSGWQVFRLVIVSVPKQIFRLIKSSLISSWNYLVGFIVTMLSFAKQEENPFNDPEWVIRGRTDGEIGKTASRPQPDECHRYAFHALTWILNNSTEWETVKEVLDHIISFPDVILDSFADGDQLYKLASTAVEHLNHLQHDPAEWRHTLHINSSCARLIYLTTLPWLHKSTDPESKYSEIQQLSNTYRQLGDIDMSPEEVQKQVVTIQEKMTKLSEPVAWLEDLAGRIVLGCRPEPGLKICNTLGRTLLNEKSSLHARCLDVEVYPTLWWIFLNTVMDCTYGSWPSSEYKDEVDGVIQVCSDSALTLSYFRDSRKRQDSGLWLAVVGITGMIYAFVSYPDHENGPAKEINKAYFLDLINFLRLTLRTQVALDADLFIGDLPVYNGTEIRLYEFDSLQYGIDALSAVLNSPAYANCPFSGDLHVLLHDMKELKDLKVLLRPKESQDLDHGRIREVYKSKAQDEHATGIFLTAGVLSICTPEYRLDRECAHFLASFLPDIIFGRNAPEQSTFPAFPKECIGMVPTTDQCIGASDTITNWAWVPFSVPHMLQNEMKAKYPNYRSRDMIWEPLENIGLLRAPVNSSGVSRTFRFLLNNGFAAESPEGQLREAYRATGYCLYIKASLLNRLYSLSTAHTNSPDVLAWSIALAKHVVQLLQYWEAVAFTPDEQILVIMSLSQLVNTLLDAVKHDVPSKSSESSQSTADVIKSAQDQLEALIKAGVLSILARPFSPRFPPYPSASLGNGIPDQTAWYNNLTRVIERLARTFPNLQAEKNYARAIGDALEEYKWLFDLGHDTPSGDEDEDNNHAVPCMESDSFGFYSDIVAYYGARESQNNEEWSLMLELVKSLRGDTPEEQHPPASPRVESPVDVRIDMSQGL